MPCICLLPFTHRRALYFLRDPSGRHLRLYVKMRSRNRVRGGRSIFGINSKVFMSIKLSISGHCASTNLFAFTCLFICACVSTSGFCICMAYNVGSKFLRNMPLIPGSKSSLCLCSVLTKWSSSLVGSVLYVLYYSANILNSS
jgi:hypothetical protein